MQHAMRNACAVACAHGKSVESWLACRAQLHRGRAHLNAAPPKFGFASEQSRRLSPKEMRRRKCCTREPFVHNYVYTRKVALRSRSSQLNLRHIIWQKLYRFYLHFTTIAGAFKTCCDTYEPNTQHTPHSSHYFQPIKLFSLSSTKII